MAIDIFRVTKVRIFESQSQFLDEAEALRRAIPGHYPEQLGKNGIDASGRREKSRMLPQLDVYVRV